jgi:hypothetical protein
MRRSGLVATVLIGAAVLALAATAALRDNRLAFTLGVTSAGPVAELPEGQRACQRGVAVPPDGGFDRVRLALGTYSRPGPPVSVTVEDAVTGARVAGGRLEGGYPDIGQRDSHVVPVGEVAEGRRVSVCVANEGPGRVAVYGNAGIASRTTSLEVEGKPVDLDMNLVFETDERATASLLPAMAERASLFRAAWVGPWTYAVLAALVLGAVPALLVRALAAAEREPE